MFKLPLTVWALFFTAIIGILSFPVLVACVVLLIFDRSLGTSFYLSNIVIGGKALPFAGGSPILISTFILVFRTPRSLYRNIASNGNGI
jgi:cytochrome c oxidase subunit 1